MVTKAYNTVKNMRKKGGSTPSGMPQSGKAKAPPQVPPQVAPQGPQDDSKDAVASALADVTAYATALLSGKKGQAVTTVDSSDSDDGGDKKLPTMNTPPKQMANTSPKLKDPPDQQGVVDIPPNQNVTMPVATTHTDAGDDGLGTPWMPQIFGGGTPFLAAQSDIQFASQVDTTQGTTPPNQQDTTPSSATVSPREIPHNKRISC